MATPRPLCGRRADVAAGPRVHARRPPHALRDTRDRGVFRGTVEVPSVGGNMQVAAHRKREGARRIALGRGASLAAVPFLVLARTYRP